MQKLRKSGGLFLLLHFEFLTFTYFSAGAFVVPAPRV
jgi:hypothetical protein